jgi:hypothetical protein
MTRSIELGDVSNATAMPECDVDHSCLGGRDHTTDATRHLLPQFGTKTLFSHPLFTRLR